MKKLSFIPLLIFLLVNIQCGGGGDRTYSGTTPVSIKVTEITPGTGSGSDQLSGAVSTGDLASAVADVEGEGRQLSLCRITITGPGMEDMVREVDIAGKSSIRETFNVPSGLNRSFLIQMFIENNDSVIVQANSAGHNLEGKYFEIPMEPTIQADYYEPPDFPGLLSVSNSETRSVMLNWKPASDNITDQKRIQYLIYLTTQSKRDQNINDIFKAYERGTGTIRDEDPLMSYTYEGEKLILLSYEYEGALPADDNTLDEVTSSGRLKTGVPYLFIVRASDEWGFEEDNLIESEQIVVYMLDVEVQGSGTVTSEPMGIDCGTKCSEDFLSKNTVTLTAAEDEGADFEGWTGNDQCEGTGDCVLTLSGNESITAKFCQKTRYYHDADGDGYGGSAAFIDSCSEPDQDSYVENNDDCDDSKPEINPSAIDFCNNDIDENCDGTDEKDCDCNEGETRPCGIDTGECEFGVESCTVNLIWSGKCDGDIGPSQELCDGLDNDCNGQIDEPFSDLGSSCSTGLGACESSGIIVCDASGTNTICDATPGIPSTEECDGIDNDCNGEIDDGIEDESITCGVGACESDGVKQCINGQLVDSCTPGDPSPEICDGEDNDCDPSTADGSDESWIGDDCDGNDSDKCKEGQYQCTSGSKTCSDKTGNNKEVCDGKDNDCDGNTDETGDALCDNGEYCDGKETCTGTGGCKDGKQPCSATETCNESSDTCDAKCTDKDDDGYSLEGGSCGPVDCDDNDGNTHPDAQELCDGKDNNCNGLFHEVETDSDGDGYFPCEGDCDDTRGNVNPGHDEVCNDNLDNDCDGLTDYDDTGDCIQEPCGGCPDGQICIDNQCELKTQQNSCEARGACCEGRDDTCTAPGDAICFCDEYCVTAGDCCTDYQSWCQGN